MKYSFQKKLFLSISAFIVVLLLLCICAFSFYTYHNLYQQSQQSLHYLSERTASELESLFNDMDKLALYTSTSPEIRSAFTKAKSVDFTNAELDKQTSQILTSISIPNSSSHYRISLYNKEGKFVSIGLPYSKSYTQKKLFSQDFARWYSELPVLHNTSSFYGFHKDYWSGKNTYYLSLFREIFDSTYTAKVNGIIEIQCPLSTVETILDFEDSNYTSMLFDDNGTLIYPLEDEENMAKAIYSAYQEQNLGSMTSHGRLIYSENSIRDGFHLVLIQSEKHIWKIILPQILIILFLGLIFLVVLVILVFYITKRATRPLQDLTASVRQVSFSNLSLELNFSDYPDEISGLNEAFDTMFCRLRQSMDEIVRIQACENRANMVALQSQMDPHFLFNTLTVIKALAREENTRQIALTCDYLVKMLRYISSYDEHSVSLKQELTHTENYLNLMKIRYEDSFTYSFSIDSNVNTETLRIPRLTLQPLVENCFQHGFKSVAPPWNIQVRFWMEAPHWFVSVTDNGAGVAPEKIQEIFDKIDDFLSNPTDSITSMKIGGMGLVNTVARLKLKYKDHISFQITNVPGGGTIITLGGLSDVEDFCD